MYVASTFRRIIAHCADELISAVFLIPVVVSVWVQMSKDQDIIVPWRLLTSIWLARVCYEIICIYILQAMPAQRFFGLKILSTYHPELGLGLFQTTIRVLVAQLKYVLGPSIYFLALFHRDRQHLGDILAETRVVQINERNFSPKARIILGSILVFASLLMNLNEAIDFVGQGRISPQGIKVEMPTFELSLNEM